MTEIADLFAVTAANLGPPPLGAPERHDRDDVNNISRELMGKIRRQWEGLDTAGVTLVWKDVVSPFAVTFVDADTVLITGVDATGMFPTNRKVKVTHPGSNSVYAFVSSSSFAGGNTTVNLEDFDDVSPDDAVRADANNILMFNGFGGTAEHGIGRGAFSGAFGAFEIPTALTGAAINTAITNALAADRIVLLQAATYTIETPVLIKTGTRLWGLGPSESILQATTAGGGLNDDVVKIEASADHFELRSFAVDGQSLSQSAGNGIRFQEGATRITLDDLFISGTWEHGIALLGVTSPYQDIHIRNVDVGITGGDCVRILEPTGGIDRCSLHAISVLLPGTLGSASATANGFYIEGRLTLSDLHVDLNVAAGRTGAGIYLADVGSGGSPAGARCTLSGFTIEGTAQDMVGLRVGGVLNTISNGICIMTGSAARPLLVDGRGGGIEQAIDNLISNCIFHDGIRCEIASDAPRTQLFGCQIQNQSSEGLRIDAADTLIKSCAFFGHPDGITIRSTAVDTEVVGCTFRDQTDDGVVVLSGSDGTVIRDCVFRDVLGDAIQLSAVALNVTTGGNVFHDVTGSNINDNTAYGQHDNQDRTLTFTPVATEQVNWPTTEQLVNDLSGIQFPRVPDGSKRFFVTAKLLVRTQSATADIVMRLRKGTAGGLGDAILDNYTRTNSGVGLVFQMGLARQIVTPAALELLTLSVEEVNGPDSSDYKENGGRFGTSAAEESEGYILIEYVDG